jgi:mRNA interferase RelE/StbE
MSAASLFRSINGGMTWGLALTKPASRDLRDVPRVDLEDINAVLEEMRTDPYGGDIRFLKGTNRTLRRRVGDWRILFEVHADRQLVVILGVVRRGSNTY